jgi:hypothetical protein
MTDPQRDTDSRSSSPLDSGSDGPGLAALLLVESLLHGLVARSAISLEDAVEYVGVALDVRDEMVAECGADPCAPDRTLGLLAAIKASLSRDLA